MFNRFLSLLILSSVLSGCSVNYQHPIVAIGEPGSTRVIEMSFDETWQKLISNLDRTVFTIDTSKKDSGFLTLLFSPDQPSEFIDGGKLYEHLMDPVNNENYVEYMTRYHGGSLAGTMNVVVTEVSNNKTRITLETLYVFVADSHTWKFCTGSSATIRMRDDATGDSWLRTIESTHKAEQSIWLRLQDSN